jgi:adenylate cyclase
VRDGCASVAREFCRGDAVNLASWLEGLTKECGVPLIICEDTRRALPGMMCRKLDRVLVKGKANAVTIYQPLGGSLATDLAGELGEWDKALPKYREGELADAEIAFAALAATHPAQKLYTIYRARCAAFCIEPPAPDWDGETKFAVK